MTNPLRTHLLLTPALGPLGAAALTLLGSLLTACSDADYANEDHEHPRGTAGASGIAGSDGRTGPPGDDGLPGADGADGADGSNGLDYQSPYVSLPGASFYPEGIAQDESGMLYVGSFVTGAIVSIDPETRETMALGVSTLQNIAGLLAVDGTLYACTSSMTTGFDSAPAIAEIDIATGDEVARHEFAAGPGICNDLAFDSSGNLYATESFSNIVYRVDEAALGANSSAEIFSNAPVFAANYVGGNFGLNGIAFDGDASLYIVSHYTGELFELPIETNGEAGSPSLVALQTPLGAPRALARPDGIKLSSADTLMVVEQGSASVSSIDLGSGTITPLAGGFDNPATFSLDADGSAWIVNSQLNDFANGTAPRLPFTVELLKL